MAMKEKHSILFVDDEEDNLIVFEAAFERFYTVHLAHSAHDAIAILEKEYIKLIITDQRMPEMTGVQLLEVIIPQYPDIVRMILTGYSDIEAIINAINTGRVYQYITKPWDEKELKIIIDRALESYELKKRNNCLLNELKHNAAREREIRRIFQRYVPEAVVNDLLSEDNVNYFVGESRIVTILFSDIRGFTPICSRLQPAQVVKFLNRYFSIMNRVITVHHGIINKFLGDGFIAVFGAPLSSLNNAENAVKSAFEMIEIMAEFNRVQAKELIGENINIGIGINHGEVIAGNIGSEEKMEYTVIGDSVNVAQRIEEMTKDQPNSIIISESVYKQVKKWIEVEHLEPTLLRGKAEIINLYRILST